jgi:hypothetical protein
MWDITYISHLTCNHNIYNCVRTVIMVNSIHFLWLFTYLTKTFFNTNVNSLLVTYSSKYIKRNLNAYTIFVAYDAESSKLLTLICIDRSSVWCILINYNTYCIWSSNVTLTDSFNIPYLSCWLVLRGARFESQLGHDTVTEVFRSYSEILQTNTAIISWNMSRILPSTSFLISYCHVLGFRDE